MAKSIQIPEYRLHKPTGTARVWLCGKHHSLGRYDSPSSYAKYDRLIAEWRAAGCPTVPANALTIATLMSSYWRWLQPQYSHNELLRFKIPFRVLKRLYADLAVDDFGPKALKAVREEMVNLGWKRKTINEMVGIIKRMFRWAAEEEMIDPGLWYGVNSVQPLKMGRTKAPESDRVQPVPTEDVDATLTALPPLVADMVRVQLMTGCRPGEVCAMTTGQIERAGRIWLYRPNQHKTAHHGKNRTIAIGPKAKEVLAPRLNLADPDAPIFSPAASEAERLEAREAARTTPRSCGNRRGTNRRRAPRRPPGVAYTSDTYRRAIERACKKVNVPIWTPNQLRHTRATEIRRTYGLEAASAVLGHSNVETTQVYAERDLQIILQVAGETG